MDALHRHNACAQTLLRRLGEHGSWMTRAELAHGLSWSEPRVDDELADLVLAEAVQYLERGRTYRLAGSAVARLALRQMLAANADRREVGVQSPDKATYRVGIALRNGRGTPDEHIVMAEVAMDYPTGDRDALARMADLIVKAMS